MQLNYSYLEVSFRYFLKAFRESVEKEKIVQGRIAGKYSRKDNINGYRNLADRDRLVNGQEQMTA